MNGHTHSLAEWAAFLSLGISIHAAFSVPYFLLVESESARDFNPRPAVRRIAAVAHQGAVYAGHDLNRATATAGRRIRPVAHASREAFRDAVALLILLTTRPQGALR